jgi:hypothetical protein
MASRIYIIVSGLNYPEYKLNKNKTQWVLSPLSPESWRSYALGRATRILKRHPTSLVTIFDFFTGEVGNVQMRKGKAQFKPDGKPRPVISADYRVQDDTLSWKPLQPTQPNTGEEGEPAVRYMPGISELSPGPVTYEQYKAAFYSGKRKPKNNSLSVTDVYNYIVQIGNDKKRAHSLEEFHFFCHGWIGGPLLTNSDDNIDSIGDAKEELLRKGRTFTIPTRDPIDRDARAKDFLSTNLDTDAFAAAFADKGFSFVWGCNTLSFAKQLVLKTAFQKRKQQLVKSQFSKPVLEFELNEDWDVSDKLFHDLLGTGKQKSKSNKLSVSDVALIIRRIMGGTYMNALAIASKKPVRGALPGTYADFDPKGKPDETFLHIPQGEVIHHGNQIERKPNFSGALLLYKEVLDVKFDKSEGFAPLGLTEYGRGYGTYLPPK